MDEHRKMLAYVQLLDSALPIGGFSHSFGLETYVQTGGVNDIDQLKAYVQGQIHHTLVPLEGVALKQMAEAFACGDDAKAWSIDRRLHIQRTAQESRDGLKKMGNRLIRLTRTLYPEHDVASFEASMKRHGGAGTLPAVHAWLSVQMEIPAAAAVKYYLYTAVAMIANSALRLMAIGQTEAQVLIKESIPELEREWEKAEDTAEMYTFGIAQEIHAMNHETLYSRLFMS